ncbi:AraC family transcriptional regulator [Enterococcus casseliflavus]|uniref:helix-turn-helix domain-containing protein n=1 Tax=Enterococcus casseliflavus TaxID=37734 RepID=UPI002251D4CF|nr:AraC family transcriptional regulator [Enterococcus casseliflavus]MCX4169028.1 AraC family transcriptional regulator [Enterococcus casseliflavus]MDV7702500.1 AraC family transcriptional regulator [Enterococcus casseliflavus]
MTFLPEYHYHDFHEIYCLLDGEVDYYVEDCVYHMQPGNILLIHHHDIHHMMLTLPSARYERVFCYFDESYLHRYSSAKTDLTLCFSRINNRQSHFLPTSLTEVRPFIQDLQKHSASEEYGSDLRYTQCFNEFLFFLNQRFLALQKENTPLTNSKENHVVRHAIHYIQDHLSEPVKVETLAKAQFISREHLTREFKRHTGFSPHAYIQKRKLLYAKERLLEGATITIACNDAGFTNYSHFIKAFKKEFELTPRQFQQQNL